MSSSRSRTRAASAVNLAGWQFNDGVDFTFSNYSLNPGAYLVVAADLARFQTDASGRHQCRWWMEWPPQQ